MNPRSQERQDGAISKDSAIRLGLAGTILVAAISASIWAGRMMTTVEGVAEDIEDIKDTNKEMWRLLRSHDQFILENKANIAALKGGERK